jgi:CRISPR-associated endoribonuclease Cas6
LRLKPLKEFIPSFEYHHKVQGFIYSLLRNTSFVKLHDKKGYKFFSFSNIFQSKNYDQPIFNLLISSPSSDFIEQISYQLQKIIDVQIPIEIDGLFALQKIDVVSTRNFAFPLEVITGTPTLIRIPLERFSKLSTESAPYTSIYWRCSHPIQLFIDAVESNLKKKYKDFSKGSYINGRIIEVFKFKKQVSTRIEVNNVKVTVIGSIWEFTFSDTVRREVQLFALDCGLGERNSLGFGFLNPILTK